ncbi:MAG: ABC transporter permease [Candidatus Hodarchaeales archaeon]|jgi:ABC-type transport system involved in multi-copper enzyme maturation permease subunit
MHKMVEIARGDVQNNILKFFVLFFIFTIQGMFSAATILLLPALLESQGVPPGIFPDPTAELALVEALQNLVMIGFIVIALMTMQVFAAEIENGTVYYSLARPVKRYEYILGKIAARMFTVGLVITFSIIATWAYTGFLFNDELPRVNLFEIMLPFILLFLFVVALTAFFSTRLSTLNSGLAAITVTAFFWVLPGIAWDFSEISPFYLTNRYTEIITGGFSLADELQAVFITLGWITALVIAAIMSFEKRDL